MTEVFKVCRVTDDGTLRSAAACTREAQQYGMDLEYPLNEEVHAVKGTVGIFCFTDFRHALDFATRQAFGSPRASAVVRCTTTHTPERLIGVFALRRACMWATHAKMLQGSRCADIYGEPRIYCAPPNTHVVPSLTPKEVVNERAI